MKKTRTRILEDMLIKKEKIKSDSNSLRIENTDECLQASINCIESNKLEQETREGYNLVDENQLTSSMYIDKIENGVITSSVLSNSGLNNISVNINNINVETGDYYISCDIRLKSGSCQKINSLQMTGNINQDSLLSTEVISFPNISNEFQRYVRKYIFKDSVENEKILRFLVQALNCEDAIFEIKNIQISKINAPYEQYGAMPSKVFQSPVEGVTEDVKLRVQNKNLAYLYNSNGFKNHTDGVWIGNSNYNCFIARVKPNTTYYAQNIHSNLCYFDKNMNFLKGLGFGEARKFNTNDLDNVCYVTVAVEKEQSNKVMIEENSEPTDFVEHKEQEFTISLENKALYKGDKLVYLNKNNPNATEGAGWYFVSKMFKYIFDGTETWRLTNTQPNNKDWHAFYPSKISNKYSDGVRSKDICFSNYYQNTNNGVMASVTIINDAISNIVLTNPATSGQIMFVSQNFTVEEMKAECKKLYDEGNPLYVVYTLQEPTYKPVTNKDLIKQLDSILLYMTEYEELTNFDFDQDVTFEIIVEKDRLSILENKLDNIEQNTTSATMLALESEV